MFFRLFPALPLAVILLGNAEDEDGTLQAHMSIR